MPNIGSFIFLKPPFSFCYPDSYEVLAVSGTDVRIAIPGYPDGSDFDISNLDWVI